MMMPSVTQQTAKLKTILITAFVTLASTLIFANYRDPNEELFYRFENPIAVEDGAFAKSIGDLLDPAFVGGNKVDTLLNGDEIFPSMLEAIRGAKKNITFETYIYWSGETGRRFADALIERAKSGVRVHVLLDWVGSGKIEKKLLDEMRSAKIEVERYHKPRWYNLTRMNNRTHRKVLIIDGRIGFTGGVGVADEWTGNGLDPKRWRDTHYRVEGPVVNQMQSAFMDNWLKTRSEIHSGLDYFPPVEPKGNSKAQMFVSAAGEGGSSVRILYLALIAGARRSIDLESAYFVPDEHTAKALMDAKKRGVRIRILVPGPYNDSEVVDSASREMWGELIEAGIEIFEYQPALFHCKVFVVDELFVSVGSTNFDERSFSLNDEANLNIIDRAFAARQKIDFEKDLGRSKPMTLEDWKNRPLTTKILGWVSSFMSEQL